MLLACQRFRSAPLSRCRRARERETDDLRRLATAGTRRDANGRLQVPPATLRLARTGSKELRGWQGETRHRLAFRRATRQRPPFRQEVAPVIPGLLEPEEIVVEAAEGAVVAVRAYGAGMPDFAEHMIVTAARLSGCSTLYTFGRKAARHNDATLLVR